MAFEWINEESRRFLGNGYLLEKQTPEGRIKQIGDSAEKILNRKGFSNKFYEYMSYGWYSLSSPIWSNFGLNRGLGISCFNSYVPDSMDGILDTAKEVGMMSKYGGGTSGYFGDVRGRGEPITNNGKSDGSVNFMRLFNTLIDVTRQGETRRGAFAAYLPIDHKDIYEFLKIKTEGDPIQGIFTGVCVPDDWMTAMINGDEQKRKVWATVIRSRCEIGLPYVFFTDTVNRNTVDVFKDLNLRLQSSNLCSEVLLPSNKDYSFVCNLSSMNISKFEEWENTDAIEVLVYLLDAVMTDFINRSNNISGFSRANKFAKDFRALGIGVLGFHDLLQSKHIQFGSVESFGWNNRVFKNLKEKSYEASAKMFAEYGSSETMKPYGRRHATLNTIAPTTSSAFILEQTSQSIEPYRSNYYVKDVAKVKCTIRNKHLKKYLQSVEKDDEDTWLSILRNGGSVQHIEWMDEHTKKVFRTFNEIPQLDVIKLAGERQKFLDQGQSLNLMIHPQMPVRDINNLHIEAWKSGIKTLYYQHSINAAQEFNRELLTCSSCES